MRQVWWTRAVTIMELIIVVAIIGIMAAVGYPTFTRIKMETRRADAQTTIIAVQGEIQRYLTENNRANLASADVTSGGYFANYGTTSGSPVLSPGGFYVIQIVPDSTSYSINAYATVSGGTTDCTSGSNANYGQCVDLQCREISLVDNAKQSTDYNGAVSNASTTKCW